MFKKLIFIFIFSLMGCDDTLLIEKVAFQPQPEEFRDYSVAMITSLGGKEQISTQGVLRYQLEKQGLLKGSWLDFSMGYTAGRYFPAYYSFHNDNQNTLESTSIEGVISESLQAPFSIYFEKEAVDVQIPAQQNIKKWINTTLNHPRSLYADPIVLTVVDYLQSMMQGSNGFLMLNMLPQQHDKTVEFKSLFASTNIESTIIHEDDKFIYYTLMGTKDSSRPLTGLIKLEKKTGWPASIALMTTIPDGIGNGKSSGKVLLVIRPQREWYQGRVDRVLSAYKYYLSPQGNTIPFIPYKGDGMRPLSVESNPFEFIDGPGIFYPNSDVSKSVSIFSNIDRNYDNNTFNLAPAYFTGYDERGKLYPVFLSPGFDRGYIKSGYDKSYTLFNDLTVGGWPENKKTNGVLTHIDGEYSFSKAVLIDDLSIPLSDNVESKQDSKTGMAVAKPVEPGQWFVTVKGNENSNIFIGLKDESSESIITKTVPFSQVIPSTQDWLTLAEKNTLESLLPLWEKTNTFLVTTDASQDMLHITQVEFENYFIKYSWNNINYRERETYPIYLDNDVVLMQQTSTAEEIIEAAKKVDFKTEERDGKQRAMFYLTFPEKIDSACEFTTKDHTNTEKPLNWYPNGKSFIGDERITSNWLSVDGSGSALSEVNIETQLSCHLGHWMPIEFKKKEFPWFIDSNSVLQPDERNSSALTILKKIRFIDKDGKILQPITSAYKSEVFMDYGRLANLTISDFINEQGEMRFSSPVVKVERLIIEGKPVLNRTWHISYPSK